MKIFFYKKKQEEKKTNKKKFLFNFIFILLMMIPNNEMKIFHFILSTFLSQFWQFAIEKKTLVLLISIHWLNQAFDVPEHTRYKR